MKKILLNRRAFSLLGVLLLSLVIWFLGPFFAFGEVRPLFSVAGRMIAIAIAFIVWVALLQWSFFKQVRASRKLASDVAGQAEAPSVGEARKSEPADAALLKQHFEEAVGRLRKDKRGGGNLYRLPWYVIIGPPGSGKTTALVNSGLRFPMEQELGKRAIKGVGGTRNCDWWFTDEAILLDTAGRYTTQDSDRIADGVGWSQFLQLLKRHRRRRPINGVLVAYSASDLLTRSDKDLDSDLLAIRQRAAELNKNLGITLPVYLLVTKVDLVAGFREYFDDLDAEGRSQVWGVTFNLDDSHSGRAVKTLPVEFDALVERLNHGVMRRLRDERDARRRSQLFGFPQQFAALKPRLLQLVEESFGATGPEQQMFLRGVYFTSGTQEGNPIDRLLGSMSRSLGLAADTRPFVAEQGRAYFIRQLLHDVVLQEAGLAGADRRAELQKAALQVVAYVALATLTVGGILALTVSYRKNSAYVEQVGHAVDELSKVPAGSATNLSSSLPRLQALRGVAELTRHEGKGVPWSMRSGLYQGRALGQAAEDAYGRELNAVLVPSLATSFAERIGALVAEPDKLYEYLKAYLMLAEPKRLDPGQLGFLSAVEWEREFGAEPQARNELLQHLEFLLDGERLRPVSADEVLVNGARNALLAATPASLAYSRLKLAYTGSDHKPLRLDQEVQGLDRVFIRRSGKSFSEPIPAVFTKDAFLDISKKGSAEITKALQEDAWVFGASGLPGGGADAGLLSEVMALYEREYIQAWDSVLADLQIKPLGPIAEASKTLGILGSGSSPLKVLLTIVSKQTNLAATAEAGEGGSLADKAMEKASGSALGKLLKGAADSTKAVVTSAEPGAMITEHFAEIHQLTEGPPGQAPIDRTVGLLAQMSGQLGSIEDKAGGGAALDEITRGAGGGGTARQLEIEAAQLPPAVAGVLGPLAGASQALVRGQAGGELAALYRSEIVAECNAIVSGRYPFTRTSSSDVPVADFARLFGPGGVFDAFFRDHLALLVDTTRSPWRWREAGGGSIGLPSSIPAQFETVERIRQQFFRPGSPDPEVRFSLAPEYLDADVERLVLEINGQRYEYSHGPQTRWSIKWPGDAAEQVVATFYSGPGPGAAAVFEGPWAFFRLVDASAITPQSDVRFLLNVQAGGHSARLQLDASSIRNPFGGSTLSRFRCGG